LELAHGRGPREFAGHRERPDSIWRVAPVHVFPRTWPAPEEEVELEEDSKSGDNRRNVNVPARMVNVKDTWTERGRDATCNGRGEQCDRTGGIRPFVDVQR